MKAIYLAVLMIFSANTFANTNSETNFILNEYKNECKSTIVTVDEIVKNEHIKGHITGLPTDAFDKFKVVFYVKTNRWYVHPYAYYEGQEEGYSYSNLNANGEFKVKTISRKVPSQKLAVVLVPKSYRIYSQRWLLKPLFGLFGGVLKNKCSYSIVEGTGDFFM